MHIHGNSMAINAANYYSAAQEARAAATRRAAEVRKKLLRNALEIEGAATPEESLLIDQWTDSRHSQAESAEQYHASVAGRDPDFG